MKLQGYNKRIIDKKLQMYLESFGAILIEGPKWCGKTWTAKNAAASEFLLADPKGNFNNKKLALMNPELVLNGEKPRLVDEWQEAPAIWDAVRGLVDQKSEKGQFILTGSATINKSSYIHSGTGRISRLRMRPMSLYESNKSDGIVSLYDICNGNTKNYLTGEVELDKIIEYILVGGWPSAANLDIEHGTLVSREYIKSVINEDIFKTDNVKRDKHKVELLFKSLSRNEATTATNTTLHKDINGTDFNDVSIDTIRDYLNLFNSLYLLENIPPFHLKFALL